MDLEKQAAWKRQLESLTDAERRQIVSEIAPIHLGGKDAALLAAPLFLTQKTYDTFVKAAGALVDAAVAIEGHPSFQVGNPLYDRLYESLSNGGKALVDRALRPSPSVIRRRFRRLDGFMTSDGNPAFIEINQSAPLAISFYERARQLSHSLAAAASADAGHSSDLYGALAEWMITELDANGKDSRSATIAVSLETGYPAKFIDLPVACDGIAKAAHVRGRSISFILAEPTAFSLAADGRPLVNGRSFDLLWRNTVYLANYDRVLEDYEQIRYGGTSMVNDLHSWFFRSKEYFAMIWDEKLREAFETFGVDVDTLRGFTPPSYSIRTVASRKDIRKNEWILKRCDDGFGKGIMFGAELSETAWRDFIHGAHGQDWIMQKIVTPLVADLPIIRAGGTIFNERYQCDFDPYIVNNRVSGILVRALPVDDRFKKMNIVEGAAIGYVSIEQNSELDEQF